MEAINNQRKSDRRTAIYDLIYYERLRATRSRKRPSVRRLGAAFKARQRQNG